ncbi:MAG: Zn-dependent hydrolase [Calditrichaeota bacterium]|nr:MAG: Zn-dependent hydrolase [Calditrichota bacterium]
MAVNFERLKSDLEELRRIGLADDGGIYRQAFSESDILAREWLKAKLSEAGLIASSDGAANVFGRITKPDDSPCILIGSHLDSVPCGGNLDGGLGVLVALESLRCIKENNIETKHPIEMVAFSDEEGRFGGPLGSLALSGEITPEDLVNAVDLYGNYLKDEMALHGFDVNDILHARRNQGMIKAYLELHIEQGPVLDKEKLNVGIVEGITGLRKWNIRLIGNADHAGTTPMKMRTDAFSGLAEFAGEIPRIIEEHGSDESVATIGKVDLFPGMANTVPGQVEFSLDMRDIDNKILDELSDACRRALSAIARRRMLMFEFDIISEIDPVRCSKDIIDVIQDTAESMDIMYRNINSGAVHDAQIISRIAPVGMIFVPSKDGRSHSPAEWTYWEDMEIGANLYLQSLLKMADS